MVSKIPQFLSRIIPSDVNSCFSELLYLLGSVATRGLWHLITVSDRYVVNLSFHQGEVPVDTNKWSFSLSNVDSLLQIKRSSIHLKDIKCKIMTNRNHLGRWVCQYSDFYYFVLSQRSFYPVHVWYFVLTIYSVSFRKTTF